MSMRGAPRRHHHVDGEAIARAGLRIVDEEGVDGLSLRRVAAELRVGTMTLYQYVQGRDGLLAGIVALLLGQVDTAPITGERWDDTVRRVARSVRAMALRHPNAFALVAMAPVDDPPVVDYARRIMQLHAAHGVSQPRFLTSWTVIDSFLTGFLLMETARVSAASASMPGGEGEPGERPATSDSVHTDGFDRGMGDVFSAQAFDAGLEIVIEGLRSTMETGSEAEA